MTGRLTGGASYRLERAWVDGAVRDDVVVEVVDGRFTRVEAGGRAEGATPLGGLTLPGLANTHSHVFHRALRGRTQRERGTFWTWREQMYGVAERLDPDTLHALARATYEEVRGAGWTAVGEFHYLHHDRGGRRYADPNALGRAVVAAARDAGLRIALLDTCYLRAGWTGDPSPAQARFLDADADDWARRRDLLADLEDDDGVVVGAAVHSVRAVPADQLATVAAAAQGRPLHVHLSEQPRENADCLAHEGVTPTRLLADHGVLGPLTSAVHATHLTDADVADLGTAGAFASFCPTTERDLADGVGPARRLQGAGARLTLGSDSHAVLDPFEEMRAVELDERLVTGERGHWSAPELLEAATAAGHASLGFDDAGRIAVGQRADLVTLDLRSPTTAGTGDDEQTAVFAATAADVVHVVVDGVARPVDRAATGAMLVAALRAVHDPARGGAA